MRTKEEYLAEDDQEIRNVEAKGFTVVYADDYTLLLDLDTQESVERYERTFKGLVASKVFTPEDVEEWMSKSGNKHVRIYMTGSLSVWDRILLQCLLGSDLGRETMNLHRVKLGTPQPIRLFKPPVDHKVKPDIDTDDWWDSI